MSQEMLPFEAFLVGIQIFFMLAHSVPLDQLRQAILIQF
jgi:hypothetical protein